MSEGRVRLVLDDGTVVDRFEEYRIRQDIRQAGASFVLTTKPLDMDLVDHLLERPECQIEVDGTPRITGRVGNCRCVDDRKEGSYANITGEDLLGVAVKSSLRRRFSAAGLSVKDSIASALAPYELGVIGSNDANRELIGHRVVRRPVEDRVQEYRAIGYSPSGVMQYGWVDGETRGYRYTQDSHGRYVREMRETTLLDRDQRELQPQPGEKIGSWIAKICEEHKLLVWLTGDGVVCVTRPRYDQVNIPRIIMGGAPGEGAVERAAWDRAPIDLFATIEVCGRVGRTGDANVVGTATDQDLIDKRWISYLLEVDDSLRDLEKANARAARLMHDLQLGAETYTVTLSGHGILDALPAVDMMFHVQHPKFHFEEDLYCIAVDFVKSRQRGTVCDVTLVRPGLLAA